MLKTIKALSAAYVVVSEADAGRTDEREAWLVQVCSGDAPTFSVSSRLDVGGAGRRRGGVGEGRVEADERVGLFVGGVGKVARAPRMSGRVNWDMVSDSGEGRGMPCDGHPRC